MCTFTSEAESTDQSGWVDADWSKEANKTVPGQRGLCNTVNRAVPARASAGAKRTEIVVRTATEAFSAI